MFLKTGVKLTGFALAAAIAGAVLAPAAQATPIAFTNTGNQSSATRFTIGCGSAQGSCANMLEAVSGTGPVTWSSGYGLIMGGPSSADPTSETAFINQLLGLNLAAGADGNINQSGNGPFSFQTDATYFMVKVGGTSTHQAYAVLHNLTGGNLDWSFDATGKGGGLSHYITFDPVSGGGTPTPVPEPGILGMFGLGLLLVGGGYALRRRRAG